MPATRSATRSTVTNTGNVTLHDVVVSDPLTGLSARSARSLRRRSTAPASATYILPQTDVDAGHRGNTATVTAMGPQGQAADGHRHRGRGPARRCVTVTIDKEGTLALGGADGRADPGDVISYTFDVTNTGNVTLHGVDRHRSVGERLHLPAGARPTVARRNRCSAPRATRSRRVTSTPDTSTTASRSAARAPQGTDGHGG